MKTLLVAVLASFVLISSIPHLRAQQDDPGRAAAAEELLKAMHADALIERQKIAVKKVLISKLPQNVSPDILRPLVEQVNTGVETILKDYTWENLKPEFVHVYASAFTTEELKQLTAFYKSPIGQKYAEKKPEIESAAANLIQNKAMQYTPQFARLVKDVLQSAKAALAPPPAASPSPSAANNN